MTTTDVTIEQLQSIYEQAYNDATNATPSNTVTISGTGGVFVERNFYWCGFNSLCFTANTTANRRLLAQLKRTGSVRKRYGGGYDIQLERVGRRGNGDYEIQANAYNAVARYLNDNGYDVYTDNRLD